MIDIHTHIIPGVDDGARDLNVALHMLTKAAQNGTKELVLTPHFAPTYGFYNYNGRVLAESFEKLRRAVLQNDIPITLHPGMEILFENKKEFLSQMQEYYPLCGSRYFLIEFYFDATLEQIKEGISTVCGEGFVPIIAHPERYECIQVECRKTSRETLRKFKEEGALFQLNKGSLSGRHGENAYYTAEEFLEQELVDFIASDAHHPLYRDANLKKVETFIQKRYGNGRAEKLFVDNPNCVIRNKEIR